jgi:hypothetical protein
MCGKSQMGGELVMRELNEWISKINSERKANARKKFERDLKDGKVWRF